MSGRGEECVVKKGLTRIVPRVGVFFIFAFFAFFFAVLLIFVGISWNTERHNCRKEENESWLWTTGPSEAVQSVPASR